MIRTMRWPGNLSVRWKRRRAATAQDRVRVVVACPWKTFGARSWRTLMTPKPMVELDKQLNAKTAEVVVAPEVPRQVAMGCPTTRRRGKQTFSATKLTYGNSV